MFKTILENEIKRRNLTVREAAREMGFTHTTLYDILNGRDMRVDTANKICKWLGVSITTAIPEAAENDATAALISTILRNVPELAHVFQEAAVLLTEGKMKTEDFQSIIEFAAFQIQKRKDQIDKHEAANPVEEGSRR